MASEAKAVTTTPLIEKQQHEEQLVTIEQYEKMPPLFDERGTELVDELIEGEIIVSPPASFKHAVLANAVAEALRPLRDRGYMILVEGVVPVYGHKESVIAPDVVVMKADEVKKRLDETTYVDYTPVIA